VLEERRAGSAQEERIDLRLGQEMMGEVTVENRKCAGVLVHRRCQRVVAQAELRGANAPHGQDKANQRARVAEFHTSIRGLLMGPWIPRECLASFDGAAVSTDRTRQSTWAEKGS
jgi:hypothetical protein